MQQTKTYSNQFINDIVISSPKEAADAIVGFCTKHCKKDGISMFHCPGCDAKVCDETALEIANDWKEQE